MKETLPDTDELPVENPRNLQDMIVSILLSWRSLRAYEIRNIANDKLKGMGKRPITPPAVHKKLKIMTERGIIDRENYQYQLSAGWIVNSKIKIDKLFDTLTGDMGIIKSLLRDDRGEMVTVQKRFRKLKDVNSFIMDFARKGKEPPYSKSNHLWFPIFHAIEVAELQHILRDRRITAICAETTPLDRYCVEFLNKIGGRAKCGVPGIAPDSDTFLFGDVILYVFYPDELLSEIEKIYQSAQSMSDVDMRGVYGKILEKELVLPALIIRDEKIARRIRNHIERLMGLR
ncbi:MAG: hypothetical protein KAW39_06800 [Thermoplasmata archaeon]|nr:hypothetical protein [Thermoplasmata archaeon]